MARTAEETATILIKLFNQHFENDYAEPFRITWPQLRSLAAVPRLNDDYLKDINTVFSEKHSYILIPLNHYLLVTRDIDLEHFRLVPDRVLEQHLLDTEDFELDKDKADDADEDFDI